MHVKTCLNDNCYSVELNLQNNNNNNNNNNNIIFMLSGHLGRHIESVALQYFSRHIFLNMCYPSLQYSVTWMNKNLKGNLAY